MPTEILTDYPLIDRHCRGEAPRDLSYSEFEKVTSESFVEASLGTTHFDAPVGLAIRATRMIAWENTRRIFPLPRGR